MSPASCIVGRLASRSITRRGLCINIHRHTPKMLHLFWKRDGGTDCYTHFLERALLEDEEDTLIQDYIIKAGLSGARECLNKWLSLPEGSRFRPCIFWTLKLVFHPLHPRYRRSIKKMLLFDCLCPDMDIIGDKRDVTMTIFCLNKNSHISSTVTHTTMEITRSHYFLLPDHP